MKIAIIQYPGTNCEYETAEAAKSCGLEAEIFRWNRSPKELAKFDGFIISGGFSYQDRIRAGVIAAKKPIILEIAERGDMGAPVLGICNGCQILIESGMVPGTKQEIEMALAENRRQWPGFICEWVYLKVSSAISPFFSQFSQGEVFPIPVNHQQGRFTTKDQGLLDTLKDNEQIALQYCTDDGRIEESANPNGSLYNLAGLTNPKGNILALMPHPERCTFLYQMPSDSSSWGKKKREAFGMPKKMLEPAPGAKIFLGMKGF
ncbi:MAG: phosphoribosylformylglycinamidine synthase I [bacterium]|nr:phosphoribosylformylglycinamidine synthase I [bacterium]